MKKKREMTFWLPVIFSSLPVIFYIAIGISILITHPNMSGLGMVYR
jgi:hypothetical protein